MEKNRIGNKQYDSPARGYCTRSGRVSTLVHWYDHWANTSPEGAPEARLDKTLIR